MSNQIPFSGAALASGGYVIPDAQGALLTNAILQQNGALQLAGDSQTTSARKEVFPIWLGAPTAGMVGEGASKPVTGGELGTTNMNVKKIASIVLFTDEQREDMVNGDLNVLVDSGVRSAIADVIDLNIIGKDSGTNVVGGFDTMLRSTTATAEYNGAVADGLRLAISNAMGQLEANGYLDSYRLLLGTGVQKHIRDARAAVETTTSIYSGLGDPTYGIQTSFSTNLNTFATATGTQNIIGFLAYAPNLHVRLRKDVTVDASNQSTVHDGSGLRNLWQENLFGLRYETRLAFMAHDLNRSVIAIINQAG